MTIKWDEQTQNAVILLGIALGCLITGLGGYYTALRKGRSVPVWAMVCTAFPPAYLLLFRKSSNRAETDRLHPIEYVALLLSGASALLIILLFLLLCVIAGSRGSTRSRGQQGSSFFSGGGDCCNGGSGSSDCGGGDCC